MKITKLEQLPIVRGIAILAVLFIHVSSYGVAELVESNFFVAHNFINIFMIFGMTTFIFLTGLVLFYQYSQRDFSAGLIISFYKKRIIYILLPYFIFSVLYFWAVHFIYYSDRSTSETWRTFFNSLFNGTAYYHLYFIYIIIQFYLLFPLFLWLSKRKPNIMKYAFISGIALQWGFSILNYFYLQLPNKSFYAITYMSYFMLGASIGFYYPKLKVWLTLTSTSKKLKFVNLVIWLVYFISSSVHIYLWYETRKNGFSTHSLIYEVIWNVHTLSATIVLLQLAIIIMNYFKMAANVLRKLGNASFGIYLLHPLLLTLYWGIVPNTINTKYLNMLIVISFFVVLLLTWVLVEIVSRIPYLSLVFGKSDVSFNKKKTSVSSTT